MTEFNHHNSVAPSAATEKYLLEVRDLSVVFDTAEGTLGVVDNVSLKVQAGRTLGLVGESGSGKSVTCLAALGLLPQRGRVTSGDVMFEGRDLLKLSEAEMSDLRGCKIAMVFQDPMVSLNPVRTIGWQISESLRLHQNLSKGAARRRALELLDLVGIPEANARFGEYPHQFSGGMCQRAMIAMAIACEPSLLIADEPTTALDVTIQAQILELLSQLKTELNMALILITHDLGVIAQVADDVAVIYAGRIVEEAPVLDLFDAPLHHYTQGLMNSLPRVDRKVDRLSTIGGAAPPPQDFVPGCRFAPRCSHCDVSCAGERPEFQNVGGARRVACRHPMTSGG
ncbi:ABC transporter ATP-binding protein [Candidatus Halocynthiibacter alkanivorans]|uniref:ABC transporter ATP-binding protein n=1 Tax=Candidatus Halocynthiibacter alkanivorans TaxID=2267619 RepID=UPI000DF2951F|nr:ABC transporter ATP-binding protein [Candidatus Halocynthiibacter alkanivorans]